MPLGFGSMKDIAKAVSGPAWVLAISVSVCLIILAIRCG